MYRYKNITKKPIVILINGKKTIIKPNEIIEGDSYLSSYSGLLKTNKLNKPNDVIEDFADCIVTEISEYEFIVKTDDFNETSQKIEKVNVMEKIDLTDVTFTIPISIESDDRKNNLTILLDYFNKYFNTNVIICESSKEMVIKSFWKPEWANFCKLFFMKNNGEYFYKTRLLNSLASVAKTDIIVSYDGDVLLKPMLYEEAANKIRSKELDFCYPFNKPLKHIKKETFDLLKSKLDLDDIEAQTEITHPGVPPGGCFFMNRKKFIEGGMENENMVSWGPEDQERVLRFKKLGYKVGSIDGYLYHMDHLITPNSFYSNPLYSMNVREFEKVTNMSDLEIKDYIKTFKWVAK